MSQPDDPNRPRPARGNRRYLPEDAAWLLEKVRGPVHEIHREHWEKLFDELTLVSADPAVNEERERRLAEVMKDVRAMRREYGFDREVLPAQYEYPWMFDPMDGLHVVGATDPDVAGDAERAAWSVMRQATAAAERRGRDPGDEEPAQARRRTAQAAATVLSEGEARRRRRKEMRRGGR